MRQLPLVMFRPPPLRNPVSNYAMKAVSSSPLFRSTRQNPGYDNVDKFGKLSLRRAGIMRRHKRVIVIVYHLKVCVIEKKTGEVLSRHEIQPGRSFWTNILIDEETKKSRKAK